MSGDVNSRWLQIKEANEPKRKLSGADRMGVEGGAVQRHLVGKDSAGLEFGWAVFGEKERGLKRGDVAELSVLTEGGRERTDVDLLGLLSNFSDGSEKAKMRSGSALLKILNTQVQSISNKIVRPNGIQDERINVVELAKLAFTVLKERTSRYPNSKNPIERSEEVRLVATKLLKALISQLGQATEQFVQAVYSVICNGCEDSFPDVNIECCEICLILADLFGIGLFRVAKEFIAAVTPLSHHRRQGVRIAAIKAIRSLIKCGAHEMILELVAFKDPNLLSLKEIYGYSLKRNYFGGLTRDTSPKVRSEFLAMIGDWLVNLDERAGYMSRLLPFILASLTDPVPDISNKGLEILSELGDLYEQDNKEEILEKKLYLPREAHGIGWGDFEGIWTSNDLPRDMKDLLSPFKERPSLGTRLLVQTNFGYFVGAICADFISQDEQCLIPALDLFRVCLLLTEDSTAYHLPLISESLNKMRAQTIFSETRAGKIKQGIALGLRKVEYLIKLYT